MTADPGRVSRSHAPLRSARALGAVPVSGRGGGTQYGDEPAEVVW